MPIIDVLNEPKRLSQGDVLKGIKLFSTGGCWQNGGGESARSPYDMCLVVSRPCVAEHKKHVVVAAIAKYPDQVPRDIDSFVKTKEFLVSMRDGTGSPDIFYLGNIPGQRGRFCARLDALYTVELPEEPNDRIAFLKDNLIGTLSCEFVRDLHVRIFSAFATLGFDDEGWMPDEDLEWLVQCGKKDIAQADAELQAALTEKAGREAEGKQYKEGKIEKLSESLNKLKESVEPYDQELQRRQHSN